jgi:uncharacterized metal-binding protein
MSENACVCGEAPTLIFSCSGSADVGEISDRAARKLTKDGVGKMYCLAGVGSHINSFLMNASAAGKILVIDGCPVDCARKLIEHAGFTEVKHIRVTDIGMEKGKSPATDERINEVFNKGRVIIGTKEEAGFFE